RDPRRLELGRRGGARAEQRPAPLARDPPVVHDEAKEADPDADRTERPESEELPPVVCGRRVVDRPDRVLEHVEQQEEEDARRERAERALQARARRLEPAERKAEEDRRAGDPAE